jgi:hypothetical protein
LADAIAASQLTAVTAHREFMRSSVSYRLNVLLLLWDNLLLNLGYGDKSLWLDHHSYGCHIDWRRHVLDLVLGGNLWSRLLILSLLLLWLHSFLPGDGRRFSMRPPVTG